MKKETNKKYILIGIFALAALLFLSIFSTTTSPFLKSYMVDSEIFRMLGRMAHRGMVPYKEFWDHKGPVIITIEWLGCLISEDRIGIFVIQFIFMMFTLITSYKLLRLKYPRKISIVFTLLMLLVLRVYFEGGNLTEEYCLPFLIWSCYLASKCMLQINDGAKEHPYKYSIFYGITFAVCAFTRLTNAFPLCCIMAVGTVFLIKNKKWKELLKNVVAFAIGILVIAMPYIIYFAVKDGLYEMIYATFIYNFKHGHDYTELLAAGDRVKLLAHMSILVTALSVGGYSFVKKSKQNVMSWCVIAMSVAGIMLHLNMRYYCHYYQIYIPIALMALLCVKDFKLKDRQIGIQRFCKYLMVTMVCICICFFAFKNVTDTEDVIRAFRNSQNVKVIGAEMRNLVSEVDSDDKILAYNLPAYFYIETDTLPCYRNFIIQDKQTRHDNRLRDGFEKDLKSLEAEYIVVCTKDRDYYRYMEFIDKNYSVAKETGNFRLYRRTT